MSEVADLVLSILAMDAYDQGYEPAATNIGQSLGFASVLRLESLGIDQTKQAQWAAAASSGPGMTTEKRPALKVRRRTYEALSPAEQVASRNAAWFKVEPGRNVPAETWASPYCTKWDDAYMHCAHDRATARPTGRHASCFADRRNRGGMWVPPKAEG